MKYFLSILSSLVITLSMPLQALALTYTIQPGDTLSQIARQFDSSVQEIAAQNGIANPDRIYAGQTLEIGEEELVGGSGGSYTPVTGYQSRLSVFLSSSASTINVASTKDPSGQQIVISDVSSSSSARIYLNIAPGTSKEEIVYCTGVTATTWTGCVRGLAFQGGSLAASTTLAFAHNAGSSIVISNVGQFFTEYVSRTGNQDIYDIKTFYSYPKFAVTTTLPTLDSEFATKYYVDNVGAGGFTCSNVSSTLGLQCLGSAPETVGINVSSTSGLVIDSDGRLAFDKTADYILSGDVTSTGSLQVNTPASYADAVNRGYVDQQVTWGEATGTAGIAITAGDALFVSTTSTLFKTDTSSASSTFHFVGIANSSANVGAEVRYSKYGGVNCYLSGLNPGYMLYLNGTSGQVSSTPGDKFARIGQALTSNCAQIISPSFMATGTVTLTGTGNTFVATGFYPATVNVKAGYLSGIAGSIGDDWGGSVSWGSTANDVTYNATTTFRLKHVGTRVAEGKIDSKTPLGFNINTSLWAVQTSVLGWTAWSQ